MNKKWQIYETDLESVEKLKEEYKLNTLLATILVNRGITNKDEIQKFLKPTRNDFYDPFLIKDMDIAVERIIKAIEDKEKVIIYGDYDVDGITSITVLKKFLKDVGLDVSYYIPNRLTEGYGLNKTAVEEIAKEGYSLMITVDCGITSVEEIDLATSLGLEVIVTDHHEPGEVLPKALAVIDNKRKDSTYPFRDLAGVGVSFKVCQAIGIKLGSTWIPPEIIRQFIFELLETPRYNRWDIHVKYSNITSEWYIEGKSEDRDNVKAYSTYGTTRINAYKIIEQTLNLKDVKIFDTIIDDRGRKQRVLNKKETAIASSKQDAIKEAFLNWIWEDPDRRNKLVRLYNDKFNSIRPREYDGSHIDFVGMNPEKKLRPHQLNAVAHVLYGKNADVTQCIIANGCTINGKAKHSILARDVIIEEGATVEDSILFTHTIVRKGVHLKGVVADKRCEFKTKKEVIGTSENPLYINRGAKI